jgi:hypothetical protein
MKPRKHLFQHLQGPSSFENLHTFSAAKAISIIVAILTGTMGVRRTQTQGKSVGEEEDQDTKRLDDFPNCYKKYIASDCHAPQGPFWRCAY